MRKISNLLGKKFNLLTVVERIPGVFNGSVFWKCKCICGKYHNVRTGDLKKYRVNSCGCKNKKNGATTHGKSNTKEYIAWKAMLSRCFNKKNPHYNNYGKRGIRVCKKWKNSFVNFYEDMGIAPSKFHSLDRINNNLGYFKSNCRWADRITQNNNTRANKIFTLDNKTGTLEQLARIFNINSATISRRIKRGWSLEKAFKYKGKSKGYFDYKKLRKENANTR